MLDSKGRVILADYLASKKIEEELLARCVGRLVTCLKRYSSVRDVKYVEKWLPIVTREVDACEGGFNYFRDLT